jgi:hypothetical protein
MAEYGNEGYDNEEPLDWGQFSDGIVNPAYTGVIPDGVYDIGVDDGGQKDKGYMAVKASWLDEQWSLLESQPWFRGHMNRQQSIEELQSAPAGSFVVRVSSQPGPITFFFCFVFRSHTRFFKQGGRWLSFTH